VVGSRPGWRTLNLSQHLCPEYIWVYIGSYFDNIGVHILIRDIISISVYLVDICTRSQLYKFFSYFLFLRKVSFEGIGKDLTGYTSDFFLDKRAAHGWNLWEKLQTCSRNGDRAKFGERDASSRGHRLRKIERRFCRNSGRYTSAYIDVVCFIYH